MSKEAEIKKGSEKGISLRMIYGWLIIFMVIILLYKVRILTDPGPEAPGEGRGNEGPQI